ncbi:hypothetical protein H4R34_000543 [Dimargaris verticillata]|uniref:Nuclear rim protein 1 n=1 Tax=Dimargaris verticillata TaxID=2761393 RepID=A0A9W8BA78_9FUNG|nr:hypothetical protein H4R34_000543 [Dimargaris verticillata]
MPRRERLVRRTPWYQRVVEAPGNWVLQWMEDYETIDWDRVQRRLSWPLAIALNATLVVVKLAALVDADEQAHHPPVQFLKRAPSSGSSFQQPSGISESRYQGWSATLLTDQHQDTPGELYAAMTAWSFWQSFLLATLVATSLLNTLYLFSRSKSYQMLHADPKDPLSSQNIRLTALEYSSPWWADRWYGRPIWPLCRALFRRDSYEDPQEILELDIWNPPILALNIFRWFSPAQVLVLQFITLQNWHYLIPGALVIGAQLHFVTRRYTNLVHDKQILFGQMFSEYNTVYVNPRLHMRKYDKSTMTGLDFDESDNVSAHTASPHAHGSPKSSANSHDRSHRAKGAPKSPAKHSPSRRSLNAALQVPNARTTKPPSPLRKKLW